MSRHARTPFKVHVTGVTRVTTLAKLPDSLAFQPVTLMNDFPYTSCDAAQGCNARAIPHSLQADLGLGVCRWRRLHDTGRGIEPNALGQHQCS
jgi:hypothetical protein